MIIGVPLGLIAGWSGSWPTRIIMRTTDAMLALPGLLLVLSIVAALGPGLTHAILAAAGLSFLGLGAEPPTPEWGAFVSDGRDALATAWWISTFPSIAIMVTVLAVNLVGDGLRDAFDPRLRRR